MFIRLKYFVYYLLYLSGITNILEKISQRIYPLPIRVLYAHRIIERSNELAHFLTKLGYLTIDDLEIRLKHLLKKYKFISLEEYIQYYEKQKRPKGNMMVFTMDDGYGCSNENILPLLKKYNIPLTVFLTTGNIGTDSILLHDLLIDIIGNSKVTEFSVPELSDETYFLGTEMDRINTYKNISARLKNIGNGKEKDTDRENVRCA